MEKAAERESMTGEGVNREVQDTNHADENDAEKEKAKAAETAVSRHVDKATAGTHRVEPRTTQDARMERADPEVLDSRLDNRQRCRLDDTKTNQDGATTSQDHTVTETAADLNEANMDVNGMDIEMIEGQVGPVEVDETAHAEVQELLTSPTERQAMRQPIEHANESPRPPTPQAKGTAKARAKAREKARNQ